MQPGEKGAPHAQGERHLLKDLLTKDRIIIASELIMFMIILAVIWLDEFIDLPYLFLGAPPTPYRLQEYIMESSLVLLAGILVLTITVLLLRKNRQLEHYLRVCSWCRKIWVDGTWVDFEDYALHRHSLKSSHSICDECRKGLKLMKEKPGH